MPYRGLSHAIRAIVLSLVTAAAVPASTEANPTALTPAATWVATAPTSVAANTYRSSTQLRVFAERRAPSATAGGLPGTAVVDIPASAAGTTFDALNPAPAIPTSVTALLDSYLITGNSTTPVTLNGSVTFDSPVLGLAVRDAQLSGGDTSLGSPTTTYPAGVAGRGLDFSNGADSIAISPDGLTVTLTARLDPLDQVRVVTAADVTGPTTTITSGRADGSFSRSTSAQFTFAAAERGSILTCTQDGVSISPCASPRSFTGLVNGLHTFTAQATDVAGNTGAPVSSTWTVDTVRPAVTVTGGPTGQTRETDATLTFDADEPGVQFTCDRTDDVPDAGFVGCSSPATFMGFADGARSVRVRGTDRAGNVSTVVSQSWTVDTVAPNTTIGAGGPATFTRATTASLSFSSSQAGSTFQCRADAAPDWATCTSPRTFSGLAEGVHHLQVRATDRAGNTDDTPAEREWTVDLTPPTVAFDSAPTVAGPTGAAVTFHASEATLRLQCRLGTAAYADCTSPALYNGQADGSFQTLSVRATDLAGNVGPAATHSWTVDLTAPDTSITGGPPATSVTRAATFSFSSADGGVTFSCSLDGQPYAACASPASYSGLANGTHEFRVSATDAAGNLDPTPALRTWTVAVPDPPDTILDSGPEGRTAATSAEFRFHATEPGATLECRLDGVAWASCDGTRSFEDLSDGRTYLFEVRATGTGGTDDTPASRSWTVDVTAPDTVLHFNTPPITSATVADFTFDSTEPVGATFECTLDGAPLLGCLSPILGLTEGEHTLRVTATDEAGNPDSTPASVTWSVDRTAPQTQIDDGPTGTVAQTSASLTFSASEPGSTFECSADGAAVEPCTSPRLLTGLSEGSHTFEVAATDAAGNESPPATRAWIVDTTAPDVSLTPIGPVGTSTTDTASFGFSSSDTTATFTCALDGGAPQPCTSPRSHTGLSDGSHSFGVTATDPAGNASAPASRTWIVATTSPAPNSMVALGDSLTRAFASTGCGVADCPASSWSTGSNPDVNSHTQRIRAINPQLATSDNLAVTGREMDALRGQVDAAVNASTNYEYVTIEMGSEDVCEGVQGDLPGQPDIITPAAAYRAQFADAMSALLTGLPQARVFVMSVPDLTKINDGLVGDPLYPTAYASWSARRTCRNVLGSLSDAQTRAAARSRIVEYNAALRDVCATYAPRCRYDDDWLFNENFSSSELSPLDYIHPNVAGQAHLAQSYAQAFNWVPVSTATASGAVYEDINNNGRRDAGEPGIGNRTVFIDLNANGELDSPTEPATQTSAAPAGTWQLTVPATGVVSGEIRTVLPAAGRCSQPSSPAPAHTDCRYALTFQPGAAHPDRDFGTTTLPTSMSALGDSLTRAFGAEYTFTPTVAPYVHQPVGRCDNTTTPPNIGYWDCPEDSWATGDDSAPSFNSHYKALVAAGSSITRADVHNNAYSGSKMAALAGQVAQAVAQNPDYVTIGMGGNDACGTFTGGAMTPVADYRTQFEEAMATLTAGLPNARIFVASVPNMYRLWEVMHANTNPSPSPYFATIAAYSAYIWNGAGNPNPDFKVCPSMFANPASMAQADVDRRAAALQRIRDYNDVLRDVCGQHAPHCKYDGDAGFDNTQTLTEANVPSLMSFDYFHPKPAFQSSIATATYAAGFNW